MGKKPNEQEKKEKDEKQKERDNEIYKKRLMRGESEKSARSGLISFDVKEELLPDKNLSISSISDIKKPWLDISG